MFTLYHTDGCHLCELASAILEELALPYQAQDICDDETLAARYGCTIPVLKNNKNNNELNWPFTKEDVQTWLLEQS